MRSCSTAPCTPSNTLAELSCGRYLPSWWVDGRKGGHETNPSVCCIEFYFWNSLGLSALPLDWSVFPPRANIIEFSGALGLGWCALWPWFLFGLCNTMVHYSVSIIQVSIIPGACLIIRQVGKVESCPGGWQWRQIYGFLHTTTRSPLWFPPLVFVTTVECFGLNQPTITEVDSLYYNEGTGGSDLVTRAMSYWVCKVVSFDFFCSVYVCLQYYILEAKCRIHQRCYVVIKSFDRSF